MDGFHLCPFLLQLLLCLGEEGRVDKIQVDVVGLELSDGFGEVGFGVRRSETADFGCNEEFLAGDVGFLYCGTKLCFVPVGWEVRS